MDRGWIRSKHSKSPLPHSSSTRGWERRRTVSRGIPRKQRCEDLQRLDRPSSLAAPDSPDLKDGCEPNMHRRLKNVDNHRFDFAENLVGILLHV